MIAEMRLVRFGLDCVITILFFLPVRSEQKPAAGRVLGGLGCLALTSLLYLYIDWLPSNSLRFVLRAGLLTVYLRLVKRRAWADCLYFALLCWLTFNICTEAFLTPALGPLFFVSHLHEASVGTAVTMAAYLGITLLVSRAIPMRRIEQPEKFRFLFLLVLSVIELYIKQTLNAISTAPYEGPVEFSVYMVLLQLLVLLLVVSFERHLDERQRASEQNLLAVAELYRYKAAVNSYQQSMAERRIHHDMKNHLLALRGCIGSDQAAGQYLNQLMDELTAFEVPAYTGNPILDGLLADKCRIARSDGIDLTLQIGYWPGGLLSDPDTTVIFGNLLDNAIEASRQVEDPELRSILLKTAAAAGGVCITVSNYFAGRQGAPRAAGALPPTTKADRAAHGIGLGSVKRSLEKYGGALTLEVLPERRFVATVLIP